MSVGLVLMLMLNVSLTFGQTVTVTSESTQCNGNANGAITFTASGGTMNGITILPATGTTTIDPGGLYAQVTDLAANTYSVTVTFDVGAPYTDVVDVSEPDALYLLPGLCLGLCK